MTAQLRATLARGNLVSLRPVLSREARRARDRDGRPGRGRNVWSTDSGFLEVGEQLANDVEQVVPVLFELSQTALETATGLDLRVSPHQQLFHRDPERRREPPREGRAESGVIVDDPADAPAPDARELRQLVVGEPRLAGQAGEAIALALLGVGSPVRTVSHHASTRRSDGIGLLPPRGAQLVAVLDSGHGQKLRDARRPSRVPCRIERGGRTRAIRDAR